MIDGKRPKAASLKTGDLTEAVLRMEEIKDRAIAIEASQPWLTHIEDYVASKRASGAHKSEITTAAARPGVKRFASFLGNIRPDIVTSSDAKRWKESMIAEGLSRASIAGYMRYAQSLCSWMRGEGRMGANPFDGVDFPESIPTRRDQFCTRELRDRLIFACEDAELRAVLMIGFFTGLRRNEILNLRPHWVVRNGDGRPTHFRIQNENGRDGTTAFTVKDSKIKMVPLPDPLIEFLLERRLLERSPYLIAPDKKGGKYKYRWEWKKKWANYMRKQECEWVGVHTMRHTYVTLLLSAAPEKRPSLLHISRWTGDSVDVLEKSYAHLIEDRELVNAAV